MPELPHVPNLRHLRRQARERRRTLDIALHDAQHQLAREYGFADWRRLKETIEAGLLVADWSARQLGRHELEALRDSGETPAPARLLPALNHPNPRVRVDCLGLLDHLADRSALAAIAAATRDPVPRVRRMAIHALGCEACKTAPLGPELRGVLLPVAERDPVWRVRREAVIGLAHQPPHPEIRQRLEVLARDDAHPLVRKHAAWALRIQRGESQSYGFRAMFGG